MDHRVGRDTVAMTALLDASTTKARSCTIPVLVATFLITFMAASIELVAPLIISSNEIGVANIKSASAGQSVARELATKIQRVEGSLALQSIGRLIGTINENVLDMVKIINEFVDQSDPTALLIAFANEIKFTGNSLGMFYGSMSNTFIYIMGSGPDSIWMVTPPKFQDSSCKLCTKYRQNYTAKDFEWSEKLNCSVAFGDWNADTFTWSNFRFQNITYFPTQRPWFKQAIKQQGPGNATIQYVGPYLYAPGGNSRISSAGMTAAYPFFDKEGLPQGVYGYDISFESIHGELQAYLQTPNSFVYVMTPDGLLVGASTNESIVNSKGSLIYANESTTFSTSKTAQHIWRMLPDNKKDFTVLDGGTFQHEEWFFQLRALPYSPYFVVVNGAPSTDYTGDIDQLIAKIQQSQNRNTNVIIGTTISVFALTMSVGCLLTYYQVTVPLKKMTAILQEVANFDFTAYKEMELKTGSLIVEVAGMEFVFFRMIGKFAAAIRKVRRRRNGKDMTFRNQKFRLPVLLVVFLQTLCVTLVVLIIPLVIIFTTMASANELSVSTGQQMTNALAIIIQSAEGTLALKSLGATMLAIRQKALHMVKAISAYGDRNSMDSLLYIFASEAKYTNYSLNMYYGSENDTYTYLKGNGKNAIWITIPAGYNDPSCAICAASIQNYSQTDNEWVQVRNCSSAYGDWDQDTWEWSNFYFANFTYHPTRRPWYRESISQDPRNATVQFSSPYLFQGQKNVVAGITVDYPFFDVDGSPSGVYASDVSFDDLHNICNANLQTSNSFMYVMTSSGQLVGSSGNDSVVGLNGNLIYANESTNPITHLTAAAIWNSLESLQENDFATLDNEVWDVGGVTFQLRALPFAPFYVIVNGAPKADYAQPILDEAAEAESMMEQELKIIVAVSAAGFLVISLINGVLIYYGLSRPMARVTAIMVAATDMDFNGKVYENRKRDRGFITDLVALEDAFERMLVEFASSVRETQSICLSTDPSKPNVFIYRNFQRE
ncbi:hypothetical protein BC830DRAFT_1104773, partial [Chytriomyces sp. MP71]